MSWWSASTISIGDLLRRPVTTIAQPIEDLGRQAVKLLVAEIAEPGGNQPTGAAATSDRPGRRPRGLGGGRHRHDGTLALRHHAAEQPLCRRRAYPDAALRRPWRAAHVGIPRRQRQYRSRGDPPAALAAGEGRPDDRAARRRRRCAAGAAGAADHAAGRLLARWTKGRCSPCRRRARIPNARSDAISRRRSKASWPTPSGRWRPNWPSGPCRPGRASVKRERRRARTHAAS